MEFKHGNITLIHGDCMEYMEHMDWKADLAIVDPPYGIGYSEVVAKKKVEHGWKKRTASNWDNNIPSNDYFKKLLSVSKNQIIWGGNYFNLPPTRCFIIWDKIQRINQADCELAWTSFKNSARIFQYARGNESGFAPKSIDTDKPFANIHPTQKPVALYKWLLTNYAKKGDRIIDTHGGSMSIAIACYDLGFELVCIEKDLDYFNAAVKRFKQHIKQAAIQFPEQPEQPTQSTLEL